MGQIERARGKRFEYRIVKIAESCGLPARRIVLSGATTDEKGDVEVAGFRFECKYRGKGFVVLREWVDKATGQNLCGVILGGYRTEPLVVIPIRDLFALLVKLGKNNG